MDYYAFYTGQDFDSYKYLGAHLFGEECVFRTFAPQALEVNLVLEDEVIPMSRVYDGNFYEVRTKAYEGEKYEYQILGRDGSIRNHLDPYGFGVELRPNHKSVVTNIEKTVFSDHKWMKTRTDRRNLPLNIYEVHAGSWKKKSNGKTGWYNYMELAELLVPYLKEHFYNYVEFIPLCEHPTDESWGYQITGYFAPTSRYGSAMDLMKAIDYFHNNGIGVILDFVPTHFALDYYGLSKYDGTSLYEYPSNDVGFSEWGSCNFMHSRPEVRSFLQSSVNYWLREYHFDGIRMDAVSRLIYWQGDETRGENGSAIDFIKCLNKGIKERNKGIMLIAEDSTNYPKVTENVDNGGLGFDYKWDLGWMNDTFSYFKTNPYDRTKEYHKLTFSMMYFSSERYIMPFSHDEVVHGKATIVQKMNGNYENKFPQARALYMYMYAHPGKKLNFMGNEIGQFREWDENREQDWDILKYPIHDSFERFMKDLCKIYLNSPALYELDYVNSGFEWIDCHQEEKCIYAFERRGEKQRIITVINLSDKKQSYKLNVTLGKCLSLLISTNDEIYGGKSNMKHLNQVELNNGCIDLEINEFEGLMFEVVE